LEKSGAKSIGTTANLVVAAAAGACTVIVTQVSNTIGLLKNAMGLLKINLGSLILFVLLSYQPLDTAASRMQTSAFGKSKGLRETLSEGTWMEAFDGLGISIILTCNPSIQVLNLARFLYNECCIGLQIDNMSYGVQLCQLFVFKQLNIDTEDCVDGILYSEQTLKVLSFIV
jgi:hypothetical protein